MLMAAPLNHREFYRHYREAFGRLSQGQVNGMNVLLGLRDKYPWPSHVHEAYWLATVAIECDWTWFPIIERGPRSYFRKYEPGTSIGRVLGNTAVGDGYRFRGRGYVMLTGRRNFTKAAALTGHDVLNFPTLALDADISYRIGHDGMLDGWFTGLRMDDFIDDGVPDFVDMRRVVNGLDRAREIAGIADAFLGGLRAAAGAAASEA